MGGISLAIGLTCVGMGLPMIAAESGFWDQLGVVLLASGMAMTLLGLYLIWQQNREARVSSETTTSAKATAAVGPAIANPQAGRDIHVGGTYNLPFLTRSERSVEPGYRQGADWAQRNSAEADRGS